MAATSCAQPSSCSVGFYICCPPLLRRHQRRTVPMRAHKNPTGRLAGTPTVVLLLWVSCMLLIKTAACKAACATVVAQCHSNDRKVHVLHCPVLTLLSLLYGCTHVYMDICTSGHFNLAPVTSASVIATRTTWQGHCIMSTYVTEPPAADLCLDHLCVSHKARTCCS